MPIHNFGGDFGDRRAEIHLHRFARINGEAVARCLRRIGDVLQFDGSLSFECDLPAEADDGGDRVEQAAARGGLNGIQTSRDHAPHHSEPLRGNAPQQLGRILTESIDKIRQGHAPGFAHSGITTRQRDITKVRVPYKSVVTGDQELAAPDAAIGSVSRAIERHADGLAS